jgi:signal transduction histidine kinase
MSHHRTNEKLHTGKGPGVLRAAHRRLQSLYDVSNLFANVEDVRRAFDSALAVIDGSLPLRSAILIESENSHALMTVWTSEGQPANELLVVKQRAAAAYAYLTGAASPKFLELKEQTGGLLPKQAVVEGPPSKRLIAIPLALAGRAPFGALQLEGARVCDKADLTFVNAIANQLALALDRDRSRQREIVRREEAEAGKAHAEQLRAVAERSRALAEASKDRAEGLAAENAKLYHQAQQAVGVREQILAVVSHDLKNPLHTILMTAGLLEKVMPEEQRKVSAPATARIQRAAERMLRLIGDLLDFASIEAGSLAIARDLQDPASMLQETRESFEGEAAGKELRLTALETADLPAIYCDRDRILQVLSNLTGNAIKVTAGGGKITLNIEDRGHELLFTVADDGPGISKEDAKHLFERYWRSGEAGYKGTGLGLSIAQGIVSAHGGRIWVESELGRGATFYFTIPASDDRRRTSRRSGEPVAPAPKT